MLDNEIQIKSPRIGLHYFPDMLHYRMQDLADWLPILKNISISWLTLSAPKDRAIPEGFIRGLIDAGIEPILQVSATIPKPPKMEEWSILAKSYADWGVNYITLFDHPNRRANWSDTLWAQSDLVEKFLDIYLPLAEVTQEHGITSIFPPLDPGGDYWDTAFLRSALESIQKRGHDKLLKNLVLGAQAWAGRLPLDWGAGGPERWPDSRPYFTPPDGQDQRGFRIFEWYAAISSAVLVDPLPMILFHTGSSTIDENQSTTNTENEKNHITRTLQMAQMIAGETPENNSDESPEPISSQLLAANFWLLAANPEDPQSRRAWFLSDGTPTSIGEAIIAWRKESSTTSQKSLPRPSTTNRILEPKSTDPTKPIQQYLLLPTYEWGVADWHLDVIRPYVKKYQVTVGYSLEEAAFASEVVVVGGEQSFSRVAIQKLQAAGCQVQQITGDGTNIATQLETL